MKSRRALAVAAVLAALAGALAAGWLAPAKGAGAVVRTAHAEAELVSARAALDELFAGKPVSNPGTPPYGCSVKY